jgi:hypothetical protein
MSEKVGIVVDASVDAEHWEKVLQSYGLGERPAKNRANEENETNENNTDTEDTVDAEDADTEDTFQDGRVQTDNEKIRNVVGPDDDNFFSGHQIRKSRVYPTSDSVSSQAA